MFPWFRWDAPLFFASAELFHERVLGHPGSGVMVRSGRRGGDERRPDRARYRGQLDDTLHAAGVELCFAESGQTGRKT